MNEVCHENKNRFVFSCSVALQYQLATQSKQVKPREPVIVPPETGARVGGLRGQGNWKLTKDQTGGSIAISESYAVNAATEFPPAHVHTREDELWYVMEGELKFQIGDRIAAAGPGTLVFAPRSVPHNYIVSKAPARWLLMLTPAGLDPLFPEVDELRKRLRPGTAEFRDKLEEMRAKYGVYNGEKWEGITSAEDPTDGTWELDVRASKFNQGSSWRRQTQIYKADGRNIEMIANRRLITIAPGQEQLGNFVWVWLWHLTVTPDRRSLRNNLHAGCRFSPQFPHGLVRRKLYFAPSEAAGVGIAMGVSRILGLAWGGGSAAVIRSEAKSLAERQRADGGWSQLPTMSSDAYATGEALFALGYAGRVTASDPVLRKGVDYLLNTQANDGSWHVQSRAIWIQSYFESGFPYGQDQFISTAGTAWATLALTLAAEPRKQAQH